ncbi:MAG: efflux RND transporter permease subunit [Betaproteobacteria bacterium]|nr:efflux RND transporter permease subunit [Betaproteobacteria bacterium]
MRFADFFIRRPALATALNLAILLVGLRAVGLMSISQFPHTNNTLVTVTTAYPGADPATVKGFITTPLEKAVGSAPDIDYMTATSAEGNSTISVYMRLNADPNAAVAQIQSKVNQVLNQLPAGSQLPVIQETVGQSTALMYLAFNSKTLSNQQIIDYLTRVAVPQLQSVPGVGEAEVLPAGTSGTGNEFALRVWLDPHRLAAYGLTPAQVSTALAANNFVAAIGQVRGPYIQYNITSNTGLHSVAEFKDLVVAVIHGTPIHLADLGQVKLGAENYDTSFWMNGKVAAAVGIFPTPQANALDVANGVKKALAQLKTELPPGIHAEVAFNAADFIQASISDVTRTMLITLGVVVLVIFMFLGSLRTMIIPGVAIPLSLTGAAFLAYMLGYNINLLTLLALVLAIGLVVDDAIVVVENVHRHLEAGMSPLDSALATGRELAGPIVVMSTTLVAVFAPVGFMGGLTGALFTPFAFTLAASVLVSMVVALTFSPMLCSITLKGGRQGRLATWLEEGYTWLRKGYERVLHRVLDYRPILLVFAFMIIVVSFFLFQGTKKELAPTEDQGILFVQATAPPTATLQYVEKYAHQLIKVFNSFPETAGTFIANGLSFGGAGSHNGLIGGMHLTLWSQRKLTQMQLLPMVQARVRSITGFQTAIFPLPSLPGATGGPPVQFVIASANGNYAQINHVADEVIQRAQASGMFLFATKDLKYDDPQVVVQIHRNMAATLGLTMQDVARDLEPLLGGNYINWFSMGGRSYQVIPQVPDAYRATPDWLKQYYIQTAQGKLVPLSTVVSLKREVQPEFLPEFQQLASATIQAIPAPGVTLGQALDTMRTEAKAVMPSGFKIDYASESRQYMQQGSTIAVTFALAVILIYLLLVAQFESFRDPLVVMFTVPMSVCGALIFLFLGFATLNIYTEMGLVTLLGLITKQGILVVQFANELQRTEGLSPREAVEKAAGIRLRPILMTTAAMVVGVIPMVLASGAGAVSRHDMGLVIATGLALGSFFSLFVVPAMYLYLGKTRNATAKEQTA